MISWKQFDNDYLKCCLYLPPNEGFVLLFLLNKDSSSKDRWCDDTEYFSCTVREVQKDCPGWTGQTIKTCLNNLKKRKIISTKVLRVRNWPWTFVKINYAELQNLYSNPNQCECCNKVISHDVGVSNAVDLQLYKHKNTSLEQQNQQQINKWIDFVKSHCDVVKTANTHDYRSLIESVFGRALNSDEIVHHIDEDRKNNSLTNLLVFDTMKSHVTYHTSTSPKLFYDEETHIFKCIKV